MLPLFSIVCAFATRLLPIVCSKWVAVPADLKNPRKSGNFVQNVLSVN